MYWKFRFGTQRLIYLIIFFVLRTGKKTKHLFKKATETKETVSEKKIKKMKKKKKQILQEKQENSAQQLPTGSGLSFNLNLNFDISEPCSATRELKTEVKRGTTKKKVKEKTKKQKPNITVKFIRKLKKLGIPEDAAEDMAELDFNWGIIHAEKKEIKIKCTVSGQCSKLNNDF